MAQPLRLADRLDAETHKFRFGRVLLTVISAPFYGVAWLVSTVLRAIWLVVAWIFAAIRVGWQDARR